MLPKKNRIPKGDFKMIFSKGKTFYTDYFVIKYIQNPNVRNPQFAVVASTKVGNAVVRNRAKRITREILRMYTPKVKSTAQIIIICKPSMTTVKHQQLEKEISSILDKVT
ncbi:ribonuclease P protein component [Patescibacteria group bacterium]